MFADIDAYQNIKSFLPSISTIRNCTIALLYKKTKWILAYCIVRLL